MLTNHANNGVQLKTLQDTAGHANIATTAAYLHKTGNERHDELIRSANGRVSYKFSGGQPGAVGTKTTCTPSFLRVHGSQAPLPSSLWTPQPR
jgi:hypothetical protein